MATMAEMSMVAPAETMHMQLQNPKAVGLGRLTPHPPSFPKQKAKLRLDPQRALEPARKKLSTVEAQRIMAVLVESIKRMDLVTVLPHLLDNLDRYNVVLGQDLLSHLQDHKVILQSFNELKDTAEKLLKNERVKSAQSSQHGDQVAQSSEEYQEAQETENEEVTENDAEEKEVDQAQSQVGSQLQGATASISSQADSVMQSLALVAKQIQFSCKNIMRQFSLNPAALITVLKEDNFEKSMENTNLLLEMNELKDIIMGMLLTTPVEEMERNEYLVEISKREQYNAGIIQKLETELQAALDDKESEIRKKNDVIRRLQADLHQIEKFSDEHIRRTKSEAEKQEAADLKNSEGKRGKLLQEINQLRTQMQNIIAEHRENEQTLRTKKYKIETEVENWIQKYDQDMGERQAEYEEIDAVYTEEKKQLNELEERFKTLEEEYNQIMEERRIARERQEARERELQMSVSAATTIQAFWRSFKVRKALKSKKKKKGGKGKKGKK